jgi:hypothetical protein
MPKSTSIVIDIQTAARFWPKVDTSGGLDACWPWMASRLPERPGSNGPFGHYGKIRVRRTDRPSWDVEYAHRVAFLLCVGDVPDGLQVLHSCDNPPCCNPNHLFVGTAYANAIDRETKHRRPRDGCKRKWTRDQEQAICTRYLSGEKVRSLCDGVGVPLGALGVILRRNGIQPNRRKPLNVASEAIC